MWGGFRITETRKQGMTWLQALRDKEVGHGVCSESQRQRGRVWGGFSLQNPESERCGQNLVFSVQLSFLTAIQESSEHSLEMFKFWVLTLPRLGT